MRKHLPVIFISIATVLFITLSSTAKGKICVQNGNQEIIFNTTSDNVISYPQDKDRGIGPVKKVDLGPINNKMADDGKTIFNTRCIVCHDLDQKKVGPPLRSLTKERTPEYIMNLLVNYPQMQKENVVLKDLYKKFNNVPMPDPAFNQTQARSVLEYLRSVAE